MQPNFLLDYPYVDRLGERVYETCPHRAALDEGIRLMLGTDCMPPSMLFAIFAATHAPEAHQRLSLSEALRAATATCGQFENSARGLLVEGAPADLIVADPALMARLEAAPTSRREWTELSIGGSSPEVIITELESMVRRAYKGGVLVAERG